MHIVERVLIGCLQVYQCQHVQWAWIASPLSPGFFGGLALDTNYSLSAVSEPRVASST